MYIYIYIYTPIDICRQVSSGTALLHLRKLMCRTRLLVIFARDVLSPRIKAIFWKPETQEAVQRTTPKVNEWPRFSPFFCLPKRGPLHKAARLTCSHGPCWSLFLPALFSHHMPTLQWFGVNKASPIQRPKRHPCTNLSHIQRSTSLINRQIIAPQKLSKLMRRVRVFFWSPCSRPSTPISLQTLILVVL